MTISEVSKKYDLSADTLRYYEKVGMIPPVHRAPNGLREYTEWDCSWVELAKCLRSAGLSVESIVEYVRLFRQGDKTLEARLILLKTQKEKLLKQQEQINQTLDRLNYKISYYQNELNEKQK